MTLRTTPPRRRGATATLLALTLAASTTASAQRTYTSLTMFGDSFTDTGNAAQLRPDLGLPSRFSNGPIWSDMLATRLGRSSDANPSFLAQTPSGVYAVAAAVVNPAAPNSTAAQIAQWCVVTGGACTRGASATGLYTMFAGANDVRAAATLATDAARRAATVAAAQALLSQGQSLVGLGARNILFAYLPNLGLVPEAVGTPASATLTDLTRLFNATLETGINQLRIAVPTGSFFDLRLDNLFANLLAQPAAYGFTNTTGSCVAAGQLPNCAGYVFFDGLHPTSAAHALVADAAYNLVAFNQNVALVPEPATLALCGAGLVAVFGIARRRRAA